MPNAAKLARDESTPSTLQGFFGRINDVDSHEDVPTIRWVEQFGEIAREMARSYLETPGKGAVRFNAEITSDDTEINTHSVWQIKGPRAPGAVDMKRRVDVLDFVGTDRQLLFPGAFGLMSAYVYCRADHPDELRGMAVGNMEGDLKTFGKKAVAAFNDWCIRNGKVNDRVRTVGILLSDTPEGYLEEAKQLVERGMRAVMVITGQPMAGLSPANPAFDPLWSFLAERNVPVVVHVGVEGGFFSSDVWRKAPAFEGFKITNEFDLDPWTTSSIHIAPANFVMTMVLGGVFERHPTLRLGCIEVGAQWIGPLAENMDLWHANNRAFGQDDKCIVLPKKPSDYIRRNVRVSAFPHEPIDKYVRDFGLDDVYCYASDFPHVEGGKDPLNRFAATIGRMAPEMMEKFFIKNAELILPA